MCKSIGICIDGCLGIGIGGNFRFGAALIQWVCDLLLRSLVAVFTIYAKNSFNKGCFLMLG